MYSNVLKMNLENFRLMKTENLIFDFRDCYPKIFLLNKFVKKLHNLLVLWPRVRVHLTKNQSYRPKPTRKTSSSLAAELTVLEEDKDDERESNPKTFPLNLFIQVYTTIALK